MLLVPFQTPQAPSVCHIAERAAINEDGDFRSSVCGEACGAVEGGCEGVFSKVESNSGDPRLLRARD